MDRRIGERREDCCRFPVGQSGGQIQAKVEQVWGSCDSLYGACSRNEASVCVCVCVCYDENDIRAVFYCSPVVLVLSCNGALGPADLPRATYCTVDRARLRMDLLTLNVRANVRANKTTIYAVYLCSIHCSLEHCFE